jgi:hypothetical protein
VSKISTQTEILYLRWRGRRRRETAPAHTNEPIVGEQIEWSVDGRPVSHGGSFDASTLGEGPNILSVAATVSPTGERLSQDLGFYDGRTGRLIENGKRL